MEISIKWLKFILLMLMIILCQTNLRAATSNPAEPQATLITSVTQIEKEYTIWLGLKFELPKGWETYWKWSGDLGQPLTISWEKSKNIKNIELKWPTPSRINILGYDLLGYKDMVIFPLKLQIIDPLQPIVLNLQGSYLVCKEDTCKPQNKLFQLVIPVGPARFTAQKYEIEHFLKQVPQHVDVSSLSGIIRYLSDDNHKLIYHLVVSNTLAEKIQDVFVVPDKNINLGLQKWVQEPTSKHYSIPITNDLSTLNGQKLKFDVIMYKGGTSIEFVDIQQVKSLQRISFINNNILLMIAISILGGFILNFMPCVLPVLGFKVLAIVNNRTSLLSQERKYHLWSALGIQFCFLLFAVFAILLGYFGYMVGWGMHFREPNFLFIMALLLILFSCNLWGFYEILLPAFNLAGESEQKGILSSFISGIFATLLATPCAAPFLGTAISYALSQSNIIKLLMFQIIGFGFALPYFVLMISPNLVHKLLPRPGNWMINFKRLMGLLFCLTAIWLLWVLTFMVPRTTILLAIASLMVIVVVLFFAKNSDPIVKRSLWVSISLLAVLNITTVAYTKTPSIQFGNAVADSIWVAFDPVKIDVYLAQHRIVFIDFTAQWCVTCKYNEKMVLGTKEVKQALSQPNVIAMKADWTNYDPKIGNFLSQYNQYAIPCYFVFSDEHPEGILLNTLLDKDEVLKHLKKS